MLFSPLSPTGISPVPVCQNRQDLMQENIRNWTGSCALEEYMCFFISSVREVATDRINWQVLKKGRVHTGRDTPNLTTDI